MRSPKQQDCITRAPTFGHLGNVELSQKKANEDIMECLVETNIEATDIAQLQPALFAELTRLRACDESEFEGSFRNFVRNLEQDFFNKEKLIGTESGRYVKKYRQTHAELLMLLHHAQARVMQQDHHLGRKIVELLPHWFLRHHLG